jgi:hypothetical protein
MFFKTEYHLDFLKRLLFISPYLDECIMIYCCASDIHPSGVNM